MDYEAQEQDLKGRSERHSLALATRVNTAGYRTDLSIVSLSSMTLGKQNVDIIQNLLAKEIIACYKFKNSKIFSFF